MAANKDSQNSNQVLRNVYDPLVKALRVILTSFEGDIAINADNVNLEVQLSHEDPEHDSVRVGDGTNELGITGNNEAKTHDADVLAKLDEILLAVDQLEGYIDGVESLLSTLNTYVDGLEGFTDGLEGLATLLNGYVDQLEGFVDQLEGYLDTVETKLQSLIDQPKVSTGNNTRPAITNVSATVLAANPDRKMAYIWNRTGVAVSLSLGGTAVAGQHIRLANNDVYQIHSGNLWTGAVSGIRDAGSASVNLEVFEGTA